MFAPILPAKLLRELNTGSSKRSTQFKFNFIDAMISFVIGMVFDR